MKILMTRDVGKERLGDVGEADIVAVPERTIVSGEILYYYVYKNKVTGIKGTFSSREFSKLVEESFNCECDKVTKETDLLEVMADETSYNNTETVYDADYTVPYPDRTTPIDKLLIQWPDCAVRVRDWRSE